MIFFITYLFQPQDSSHHGGFDYGPEDKDLRGSDKSSKTSQHLDWDALLLTNEIPQSKKIRHHHNHKLKTSGLKSFRNTHSSSGSGSSSGGGGSGGGYHASTGPTDFFKKKYKSAVLEVKKCLRKACGWDRQIYEREISFGSNVWKYELNEFNLRLHSHKLILI